MLNQTVSSSQFRQRGIFLCLAVGIVSVPSGFHGATPTILSVQQTSTNAAKHTFFFSSYEPAPRSTPKEMEGVSFPGLCGDSALVELPRDEQRAVEGLLLTERA